MGNAKNLSFSTGFNHQKIHLNGNIPVTIPASAFETRDTLFTVITGLDRPTTARFFIEKGGVMQKLKGRYLPFLGDTFLDSVQFFTFFDSSNNVVMESYNSSGAPINNVTFYYRIYTDGRPR